LIGDRFEGCELVDMSGDWVLQEDPVHGRGPRESVMIAATTSLVVGEAGSSTYRESIPTFAVRFRFIRT